jgi:hypothetical protein
MNNDALTHGYLELFKGDIDSKVHIASELSLYIEKTEDETLTLKISTEVKCFELFLSDGYLKPIIEFSTYIRTDIEKLNDKEINYILSRSEETALNVFLIARYNHILFLKKKHQHYAIKAIEAYSQLAKKYFNQLANQEKCINDVMEVIKAGHHLSETIRYKPLEEKKRILDWWAQHGQGLYFYQNILELIVTSKLFKRVDVIGLTAQALSLKDMVEDCYDRDYYLEICLLLAKKEGYSISTIYVLIADSHVAVADTRVDDGVAWAVSTLLKAAIYYKKAGDKEESNKILRRIEQHKAEIYLGGIEHQCDDTDLRKTLKEIVEQMIADDRFVIFVHLAMNPNVLTTSDNVAPDPNGIFLKGITTTAFDNNINSSFLTPYEQDKRDKFLHFFMFYERITIYLMIEIKKQMKKDNRDFLSEGLRYFKNSWLGATLEKPVLSEAPERYQWYRSLEPALKLLINISEDNQLKPMSAEEQMAFDQLSVKFEGPLRDICQLAKITTTRIKDEQILYMDINELLASDEVAQLFKKEDLELWQYIFTGSGYNIRNDVAHGFYRVADYTVGKAQLLLLSYIKLAKYSDVIKKTN